MVSHWSLSKKSLQILRTLLSILADLNNAAVWMVFTRPLISKSSSLFINHLVTVPRVPITISISVTFMLYSFFNSLARLRYLSFFLFVFFQFYSEINRDKKVHNFASSHFFFIISNSGTVEYTDFISIEEQDPSTSFLDMKLNNLVRYQ